MQYGDPRRSAPATRHGDAVLRRADHRRATDGARARRRSDREHRNCATSPTCPMRAPTIVPLIRKLRLAAGEGTGKFAQQVVAERPDFVDALDALAAGLDRLAGEMQLFAERSEDVAVIARRAEAAAEALARWKAGLRAEDAGGEAWIRWIDVGPQGFQLHASPLSVADVFRRQVEQTGRAWIFTSATLAVGRDFSHYTATARARRRGDRLLGKPVRLSRRRACCTCRADCRAEQHRAHERRRRRGAAGAEGERRTRLPAVHDAARAQRGARASRRAIRARATRLSGARSGRRVEDRAAAALSRARQRGAARQRELLGRRRRPRRCAVARRDRQAAVRAAGRSAAGGAARASSPPMAATRSFNGNCRRRRSASSKAPAA